MNKKIILVVLTLMSLMTVNAQNKNINDSSFPDEWWDCILNVTGTFETSNIDWGYVTPDFDGQGLSCGLIQVNIGQSSFQPFFLSFPKEIVESYMPNYGLKLVEICKMKKKNALEKINEYQEVKLNTKGKKYKTFTEEGKKISTELRALLTSEKGISKQKEMIKNEANSVWNYTKKWAIDSRGNNAIPNLTEFLVFYDNKIFNGSMKIDKNLNSKDGAEYLLSYKDAVEFKNNFSSIKEINDSLCNWLSKPLAHYDQKKEAVKNSELWRGKFNATNVDLFIISYLRALYSNGSTPKGRFKANVLSRRGTIILNNGYVNGTQNTKSFDCLKSDSGLEKFLQDNFKTVYSKEKVLFSKNTCNITDAYFVVGMDKFNKLTRTIVYKKNDKFYQSNAFI